MLPRRGRGHERALGRAGDLTLEALAQRVVVEGADGRWRLRPRRGVEIMEDVAAPELPAGTGDEAVAPRGSLRPGCYVVFDLEATGQDPRAPETEIIQIAA